ncbi:hypothetical protein O0I10_002051 [Lichtheimia ornata]|uniref:Rhodanese domain-containing protein n=1 Tax=Lichtheimia ornata TaxID=688661 RepID=A0AAD7VCR2_9FUNG|nr:uncharacterized protein O0I10_002051 [Lichtheimia ornata]KAJ8662357.1 hypothetical protein O0I10_002051 [Lichtheimia ornata]
MSLPTLLRATCSNVLRQNILRHQPRVIRKAASVALSSQLKPIAWQRNALVATRRFTSATENNTVDYEYIQTIIKDNKQNTHLIDVREPNELLQGSIPSAKNVPLSKFLVAWSMSEEDFEDEFGFEKPSDGDEVVLYCQAGIRSNKAADFLREIGYKRVFNYPGSWADYAERTKSG